MIAKKGDEILSLNFIIGAALVVLLTIVIGAGLIRYCTALQPLSPYQKTLNQVSSAVNALSPDHPEITRKIPIMGEGYYLKGFSGEFCPGTGTKNYCVCACFDSGCLNAEKEPKKYCIPVKYNSQSFIISVEKDKSQTYEIKLDSKSDNPRLIAEI